MEGKAEPTILYVDDQPSHRILFQKAFGTDCLVLTASSADEGVEILKGHDIFLVVADQSMPGKSGIDFLEEARGLAPQALRAILSAHVDPALIKEAKARAGIFQYLRKPWKRDEIKKFIESAFRQYRLQDQPAPVERPITAAALGDLLRGLEPLPTPREIRRLLLNHVEPRLKNTVALIMRPCPPALHDAQRAAIVGNINEMEQALIRYLKEEEPSATPAVRH